MSASGTKWHVHLTDILGAVIVIACLSCFVWFAFIREDDSGIEIARLERQIARDRQKLAGLHAERDREGVLLEDRERRLKESGSLPREAPVEPYLQTLSALAKKHGLDVIRQSPLPPQEYPGLLERRHTYEVSGEMVDIARFFEALEQTDFWADISFLKIVGAHTANGKRPSRVASLTISVFSAPPSQPGSDQG